METTGRTLVCSVLFLDIVEYSKKPVSEQLQLKQGFNDALAHALEQVPPRDRIILDTGDGAAVTFMGDPEDALFAAMSMRDMKVPVRLGVNLGPVRLVKDLNGQVNIIGDGINVAQRVMSFSQPGQLLVSRSFYEVVSCLSRDYASLFRHEGARTDKHVREHDVYSVVGGAPHRLSDTHPGAQGAHARVGAWLSKAGPLGLRRSALLAAPLLFTLIVTGGVGARALLDPPAEPAAAAPVAQPAAPPKPAPAPAAKAPPPAPPPVASATSGAPVAPAKARAQERRVERAPAQAENPPQVAAAAVPQTGRVEIQVLPWGEILIDGKSRGVSPPLRELEIPAGPHTIEIRNSTFPAHLQRIDVKAGQATKIRHRFR